MDNEIIRPIDEASAKAIEQTAILGQKLADITSGGGRWLTGVLGQLPHNLVGIADDRVAFYRARRWIEMNEDLEKDLLKRGVKDRTEPSFTVLMPLLEAAIDENRSELKDIWRRLLANAFDPARTGKVRLSFIETAKQLDPLDAAVLQAMGSASGQLKPNARDYIHSSLGLDLKEIMVSFDALQRLGLIYAGHQHFDPHVTDKGALFLLAAQG